MAPPPNPLVGQPFSYQLTAWGGDGNYIWSIASGTLPNGVTLTPSTGLISGVPTTTGSYTVTVSVTDTAIARHTGNPQRVVQEYVFSVNDTDSDADGLTNSFELSIGTNLNSGDTDGDGLTDYQEVCFDGNCLSYSPYDATTGTGSDTNATVADTDGDGLSDGAEVGTGTDPLHSPEPPGIADGDLNADAVVDSADLLIAQKILMGLISPSQEQLQHGDVAPLVGGTPAPNGEFNPGDLLIIQRKINGEANF